MKYIIVFGLLISACGKAPNGQCYQNNYQMLKYYPMNFTEITPGGIEVDSSGQYVDLNAIDQKSEELEACLSRTFGENPNIEMEVATQADCRKGSGPLFTRLELPIILKRNCIKVKIPDDWSVSPCSGEEMLNIAAPDALCLNKGITPTQECPCRWRVATQESNTSSTIITPPGLRLYKAELARIVIGCNNVWLIPQITACLH